MGGIFMNYFLVNNLGNKLTGIEKSVINRFKLFHSNKIDSHIITLSWNPHLHKHSKIFGINNNIFSMFDFFQEARHIHINTIKDWIEYWKYEQQYEIKYIPNTHDVRVFSNGTRIIYASFHDSEYKYLNYVNYIDSKGRKIKREHYDSRGFLSRIKYLTTKEKTVYESYLTPKGDVKLEIYYGPEAEKERITRIMLNNFHNRDYTFDNKNELAAFFYENLYKDGDLFFSDKTGFTSPPFLLTDSKIPVVSVLHSTHVKNNDDIEGSDTKNIYKSVFSNLNRFSGIIVSTKQQKLDIERLIHSSIPVFNIPVGYTEHSTLPDVQTLPKGPIKLMSIARYSPEKQLDHQIRLVSKLKEDFDQIELHLFGFGKEQKKLEDLVNTLNLEDNVKFRGFIPDLTSEMHSSHVSLITSNMEGFSLALLESLSNGLPAISYDIAYGPSELIINDKNGYLVPKNDEDKLYETVKTFLNNPELQKSFRSASIIEAQKYSQDEVIKKWHNLFNVIKS